MFLARCKHEMGEDTTALLEYIAHLSEPTRGSARRALITALRQMIVSAASDGESTESWVQTVRAHIREHLGQMHARETTAALLTLSGLPGLSRKSFDG